MSTILKALRRLEREKTIAPEARSLQETVATGGSPESGKGRSWLTPGIALLLGVGVGAGLLLLWPDPAIEAVPPVSAGASLEVARAPSPPLPDPVELRRSVTSIYEVETFDEEAVDLEESGPPPGVFSSPVEVVARPARQPRIAEPPPAPVSVFLPAEPTEEELQDVVTERIVAQAPSRPDPYPSANERRVPPRARPAARPDLPATSLPEPPIPVDPFPEAETAEPETAEPRVAEPEIPRRRTAEPRIVQPEIAEPELVRESPTPAPTPTYTPPPRGDDPPVGPAVVESFPASIADSAIRVDRTWWHPMPERREAQLRLDAGSPQRLKEGDSVGGAVVTRIEPSGVVFTRNDREFRRLVGQSTD